MSRKTHQRSRRQAIKSLGLGGLAGLATPALLAAAPARRKKLPVAAVITEYWKYSHADVILGKILNGWRQAGGEGPDLELVSVYVDQFPENDLSRGLARKHGFRIAGTIDEALTLGTDKIAVAGVLSIAEHGKYPYTTDTRQHMYPRRRFYDGIVAAMKRCGQFVPVFNDKHLGYRWQDASHMVQMARRHRMPLMAGSSIPVTWRYPAPSSPSAAVSSRPWWSVIAPASRTCSTLWRVCSALSSVVGEAKAGSRRSGRFEARRSGLRRSVATGPSRC